MRVKRRRRFHFANSQRIGKNLVRFIRRNAAVIHSAARHDRQTVERNALARNHLPTRAIPFRFEVIARKHIARSRLNPIGIDSRQSSRVEPRGLRKLCSHEPFETFFVNTAARERVELNAARTEEKIALVALYADVSEQARKQRTVKHFERWLFGKLCFHVPAQVAQTFFQLPMQIAPFAQSQPIQKLLATGLHLLFVTAFLAQLYEKFPHV